MPDELQGVPGVPAGTEPGQPQTTAEEQPTPAAAPIDLSKIDLDQLPQGRALKSSYDRQVAQARREADDAKRQAAMYAQQAQAVLDAVAKSDPEAAQGLSAQLTVGALKAERDSYKERAEVLTWQQDTLTWGAANGLDVSSTEFQTALLNGDRNTLMALQAQKLEQQRSNDIKAEAARMLQEMGYAPNAQPAGQAATAKPNPILPPSGGASAPSADLDALYGELEPLLREPTKYEARITQIEQQIAQIKSRR